MQLIEKLNDGLKRELEVVVTAQSLLEELNQKISEAKSTVNLKGFRPGKVPETYLRNTYGKSFMAQIINDKISNIPEQIISKRREKLAMRPEFELNEDESVIEKVIAGKEDLIVKVKYEILPDYKIKDFTSYKIKRPIVDVPEEEVNKQVEQVLSSTREFTEKKSKAALGDRVTMDYVGKIKGVAFDNGSDKDAHLILGSKNFIPGFEEQLVGLKAGDNKEIEVTFPQEYNASELAGQEATFEVNIKKVESAKELVIDDEAAKKLGVESVEKLKELIKSQLEHRYGSVTRQKVKRQILDLLAADYDFELPQNLLEQEAKNVEKHFKQNAEATLTKEEEQEYKDIAIRRVRLGLLISKIAEESKIEVTKDELQRAMFQQIQNYPGHEKEMLKLFQNNAEILNSLKAPILEDKVIDYIISKSDVTDETVSVKALLKDDDEDVKPKKTSTKKQKK